MEKMLEEYKLPLFIKSRVVESYFLENQVVSKAYKRLIDSKQFDVYREKLLSKIMAEAEAKEIPIDLEMNTNISENIIATLKICLYRKAVEELANNCGSITLEEELCSILNMKDVRKVLHWYTTKTGISQLLKACK